MDASCSHTGPRAVARKGTKVSRCHWNPSSMHVVSSEKASIHTGLRSLYQAGQSPRCGGSRVWWSVGRSLFSPKLRRRTNVRGRQRTCSLLSESFLINALVTWVEDIRLQQALSYCKAPSSTTRWDHQTSPPRMSPPWDMVQLSSSIGLTERHPLLPAPTKELGQSSMLP